MRVDKFLKVTGLIKRRTVANQVCDAARVAVNSRPVKAGYTVKTGDVLEISLGGRTQRVEVLLAEDKPKARAEMYRLLSNE